MAWTARCVSRGALRASQTPLYACSHNLPHTHTHTCAAAASAATARPLHTAAATAWPTSRWIAAPTPSSAQAAPIRCASSWRSGFADSYAHTHTHEGADASAEHYDGGWGGGGGGPMHGHPLGHVTPYPMMPSYMRMHATTILSVRKNGKVAVIGDGQVTRGSEVVKPNAVKVRRIGEKVISGFADRLEAKLEAHPGQLTRACVELAKEWRTEKYLRRLEALMLVVDRDVSLMITGNGDVMEPVDGIIAIGSGGSYALAAARALLDTDMEAMAIAEKAMNIAADMCVYTNKNFVKDQLE